jgi:hypothetical protein
MNRTKLKAKMEQAEEDLLASKMLRDVAEKAYQDNRLPERSVTHELRVLRDAAELAYQEQSRKLDRLKNRLAKASERFEIHEITNYDE